MHMYYLILYKLLFFLSSTILDIEVSDYVRFCQILSNVFIVYIIIVSMYIAYIIIVSMYTIYFLLCIQYFFLIHLTRYILYALRTLFLITYIPYNCNYKHIKNNFFYFYLTILLKCAYLYTYIYPFVKH